MSKFIFTRDTNVLDALEKDEKVIDVFKRRKLKCTECVAVTKETLLLAALYHDANIDDILTELNNLGIEDARNDNTA